MQKRKQQQQHTHWGHTLPPCQRLSERSSALEEFINAFAPVSMTNTIGAPSPFSVQTGSF